MEESVDQNEEVGEDCNVAKKSKPFYRRDAEDAEKDKTFSGDNQKSLKGFSAHSASRRFKPFTGL